MLKKKLSFLAGILLACSTIVISAAQAQGSNYKYDQAGRLIQFTTSTKQIVTFQYDANGNTVKRDVERSLLGNLNGDKNRDMVLIKNGAWMAGLSNGGDFNPAAKWLQSGNKAQNQMLGDVNGDGKDDAVVFTNGEWWVSLSNGYGFAEPAAKWIEGHGVGSESQMLGDVNGDGKKDAVIYYRGEWWVSLSTGSGFAAYTKWMQGHGVGSKTQMLADVNGDSKADAIIYYTGEWWVSLSSGNGFGVYTKWLEGHGVGSESQMLADVNGDAKSDAVVYYNGEWWVSLSTGSQFGAYSIWMRGHGVGSQAQMVGDVNGDGKADSIIYYTNEWWVGLSDGNRFLAYTRWDNGNKAVLTLNKTATAETTSTGSAPSKATDMDRSNNSFWGTDLNGAPKWWKVDLGGIREVNQVIVRNYVDGSRYYQYNIQASTDGLNWTEIASKADQVVATDQGDSYSIKNINARYLRVNMISNSANSGVHITDFRAYGK